jgi:hypothetical protein
VDEWHAFFLAAAGAAAGLAGLVFVGVSINLEMIMADPTYGLANRALEALILSMAVLIATCLLLLIVMVGILFYKAMVHRRLRRETGRQARDVVMNIWHPVWRNWCLSAEAGRFYTQGCIQVCERTFSRRIVNRDSTPTTAKNIAGEARGENKRHPKSPEVGRFRPAGNAEWLARDEGQNCQP